MDLFQKPDSRNRLAKQLKQAFNYLMILVYICLGLFLLIKGWHTLSKPQSYGIGALLILYSIFRVFRILNEAATNDTDGELPEN
jgi:Kef-type K+ transport system membrane component KefB